MLRWACDEKEKPSVITWDFYWLWAFHNWNMDGLLYTEQMHWLIYIFTGWRIPKDKISHNTSDEAIDPQLSLEYWSSGNDVNVYMFGRSCLTAHFLTLAHKN